MTTAKNLDHAPGRTQPARGGHDAPEALEIDLERVVWDQDYRRTVLRRLGRATASEAEAAPPQP